jgi:hypothetical protein
MALTGTAAPHFVLGGAVRRTDSDQPPDLWLVARKSDLPRTSSALPLVYVIGGAMTLKP